MTSRRIALALALIAVVLAFASFALIALTPGSVLLSDGWAFTGYDAVFALEFAAVGTIIALRRPGNAIGWLFLGSALMSGLQTVATSYADHSLRLGTPLGAEADWISDWIWLPAIGVISIALILFPDGRPISPRWRRAVVAIAVLSPIAGLCWAIVPGEASGIYSSKFPPLDPLGLGPGHPLGVLTMIGMIIVLASLLAAALSLRLRMARADGIQRLQIKWVLYATALLAPALFVSMVTALTPGPRAIAEVAEIVSALSVLGIPLAAGIAILRYRLYDIDTLINRTIVYGLVSSALVLTYAAAVVVLQATLRPFTGGSELVVAASTLLVVALFQPIRSRVQDAVDRRFYRSRYDAERTLDAFAARLRDEVDLRDVEREVVRVVTETVRPAHASVWIRSERSSVVRSVPPVTLSGRGLLTKESR